MFVLWLLAPSLRIIGKIWGNEGNDKRFATCQAGRNGRAKMAFLSHLRRIGPRLGVRAEAEL
jgi:hypothetical protein